MKGLVVETVMPDSIGEEMGVEAGDRLLAINGYPLRDIIDYSYYSSADDALLLEVAKPDGELWELEIDREPGESLGFVFPPPEPARCRNNCLFCFVHQLPGGLRKPLYVKDEDYRLSFLNGNYVTLANLKGTELARIMEQRLSPLYISVHTTNPALRERLLGRAGVPPLLDQMRKLADARITMHTQVVLCPGLNDGAELERTVNDLVGLYPAVQSLAVVPLGLTRHRARLPQLAPVDADYARTFLTAWGKRAKALQKRLGEPFLFLADEFYLKAGLPFPPLREYGDLPQIENGVGMTPLFLREAAQLLRRVRPVGAVRVTVVTGVSASGFAGEFLARLEERSGARITLEVVENRLFGESVTVAGLVTGNDILAALEGKEIGAGLLLPDVMLKEGEGVFLDNVSLQELQRRLGRPVLSFDSTPRGCYQALRQLARLAARDNRKENGLPG